MSETGHVDFCEWVYHTVFLMSLIWKAMNVL